MKYPIKISKRTEVLPIVIVVASIILGVYFYFHFPETVAIHWNFQGQPDSYGSRLLGAFVMPLTLALMYVLFLVFPSLDPKKERYPEFEKTFHILRLAIMGVLLIAFTIMGLSNLGVFVDIGPVVAAVVGVFMTIAGNFMGKIKRNSYIGIKTPWTLQSENVWNKTHRFGGWTFVIFGLIIVAAPHLPFTLALTLFLFGIGLVVVGTLAYSYWLYLKEKGN